MFGFNFPPHSSIDVIKSEKIGYNQSIIVNSMQLSEVYYYSREFDTNMNYKLCTVQLNIPYSGIIIKGTIARIILYLDDEAIYDGSIYHVEDYILRPINLCGHKINLMAGHHKIKLMACTNNEELHIPHLNVQGSENIIKPAIFGSYLVIGYL